jgi:hypothetical protein
MSSRPLLALAAAALAAPSLIAAETLPEVDVAGVVSGTGSDEGLWLFGRSGQVYVPGDEDGQWRRRELGGVATEVGAILRAGSGVLFAAGDSAPLFRRERGVWYAHPLPNRGRASVSQGGAAALGIGRHVYVLEADGWKRQGQAPDDIAALWARDSNHFVVATRTGGLYRSDGRRFEAIEQPLDDGDHITGLYGRSGGELYAIAASGAVLQVGAQRAREARFPAALEGARIDAAGYMPDGSPAIAMAVAAPAAEAGEGRVSAASAERTALVVLRGGALTLVDWLPPLAAGDRIAAIGAHAGAAIVASRRGVVAIRSGDGWRDGHVSAALPADSPPRRGAGPARSP